MAITKLDRKTGRSIEVNSITRWLEVAPPKSPDRQWVEGRSAVESAWAWLQAGGRLPAEIDAALTNHPDFGVVQQWDAQPEVQLPFDSFSGEPRNADMLVLCRDAHGQYLIAVEAKADESFSETVAKNLAAAAERKKKTPASKGEERTRQLLEAFFGANAAGRSDVGTLRYQLLTACAGAVCEAERRKLPRALMLVHEFRTWKTFDKNLQRNATDLSSFVNCLSGGNVTTVRDGEVVGPFEVHGAPLFNRSVALYVGKASRTVTKSHALSRGLTPESPSTGSPPSIS